MLPLVLHLGVVLSSVMIATDPESAPATRPAGERGGNRLFSTPNDVHRMISEAFADGVKPQAADGKLQAITSRVLETEFPFNDLVPSWNIDVPEGSGFYVEIRLGRQKGDFWTPFYYLGGWGKFTGPEQKVTRDASGVVHMDYFQSRNTFDRIQYRVVCSADDAARPPVLRRFTLAYSNTLNDAALAARFRKSVDPGPKEKWARRLPVPYRSQGWVGRPLSSQCCSPTSVSMVLEYRGVKRETVEVCKTVYDPEHRLYGNWWHAVQGAWTYGIPGYVERFGDFDAVKKHIAEGQPVIASIRINAGQLRNFPTRDSNGHLLVIVGFDADGNVLINDPAGKSAEERGQIMYYAEDMAKIWLARGGVGYVLMPGAGGAAVQ